MSLSEAWLEHVERADARIRMRRTRDEEEPPAESANLTPWRAACRQYLLETQGYARVEDGTAFGAHFMCYRTAADSRQQHCHAEALVVCLEPTTAHVTLQQFAEDLRYLSAESRLANSVRKRFVVTLGESSGAQPPSIVLIELSSSVYAAAVRALLEHSTPFITRLCKLVTAQSTFVLIAW